VMVAVRPHLGGGSYLFCARKSGSMVMFVAFWEMAKILFFERMNGWVEYLSALDSIDYLSCRC